VVNDEGWLVGIVSSSFEGGPTYVTLIWDAMRLSVSGAPQSVWPEHETDLFLGRDWTSHGTEDTSERHTVQAYPLREERTQVTR
jgi:hypothetical protein